MSPRYPLYPSQPNAGNLPCMKAMGPPDLRPSSSTAPYFKRKIDAAHGRNLAGLGSTSMDMEPAYAYNELKVLDEMDDVQGNGIFDPYIIICRVIKQGSVLMVSLRKEMSLLVAQSELCQEVRLPTIVLLKSHFWKKVFTQDRLQCSH